MAAMTVDFGSAEVIEEKDAELYYVHIGRGGDIEGDCHLSSEPPQQLAIEEPAVQGY